MRRGCDVERKLHWEMLHESAAEYWAFVFQVIIVLANILGRCGPVIDSYYNWSASRLPSMCGNEEMILVVQLSDLGYK